MFTEGRTKVHEKDQNVRPSIVIVAIKYIYIFFQKFVENEHLVFRHLHKFFSQN